jgi:NAD(P)-dependent dehydrogenase (short-subunit alcohol dehydrogenase family)
MSKRVIITGAASGIGEATAEMLRSRGARVVGLDLNPDPARDILECDVRDQVSVDRAVAQAIETLGGGVDVLINNAGVGPTQSAGAAPDESAQAAIDVNLMGPWRVTSAALPALREARGRVINVASGLAHMTVPFATAYCMTKRGVVAYSDALRIEHGDAIEVTTVYPGYIRTPIHDASNEDGFALEGVVPAESLRSAALTLTRAALGKRARRDLATTRRAQVQYAFLSRIPGGIVDVAIRSRLRQLARKGHFGRSQVARDFLSRLTAN